MSMLFKRIKDWATSITAFRTGDVIPVDGPSGTAKMSKDALLQKTAESIIEREFSIGLESGTYNDGNGTGKLVNVARLRNKLPIVAYRGLEIKVSDPYQFWAFYLDSNMNMLQRGPVWQSYISSNDYPSGTAFINFAIKNTLTPSSDISGEVTTAEESMVITDPRIDAVENAVNNINKNFAQEFNSLKTYSAGDIVIHDGSLYQFSTDKPAGAWSMDYVYTVDIDAFGVDSYNCIDNPFDLEFCSSVVLSGTSDKKFKQNTIFDYTGKSILYGDSSSADAVLDIRLYVADYVTNLGFKVGDKMRITYEANVTELTTGSVDFKWILGNTGKGGQSVSRNGRCLISYLIDVDSDFLSNRVGAWIVRNANGGKVEVGRVYIGKYACRDLQGSNNTPSRVYVVDKANGVGIYNNLMRTLDSLAKIDNPVIYVKSGVYDVIDELGSEYFENFGPTDVGIRIYNGIRIVFESGAKVVCNYTGNNANVKKYFSVFNAIPVNYYNKSFRIENLDLECSNIRYGIHDECFSATGGYLHEYVNCRIKIDLTGNDEWTSRKCIGGGLGFNGVIRITGCVFESVPTTSRPAEAVVSYHNSSASGSKSKIFVRDCYVAGSSDTIKCGNYGASTEKSLFFICGCSLPKEPEIYDETGATEENFEMTAFNNEVRNP